MNGIMSEPDPEKQLPLVRELQAVQWREVPGIKVGEGFALRARRNEVKGYANAPNWFFWNSWLG